MKGIDMIHGIDIRGETAAGKKWRWVGALLADAISYHDVSSEAAAFFDSTIDTACYGLGTND